MTAASPPIFIKSGRTHRQVPLASDGNLIYDDKGGSSISQEDYAVAMVMSWSGRPTAVVSSPPAIDVHL